MPDERMRWWSQIFLCGAAAAACAACGAAAEREDTPELDEVTGLTPCIGATAGGPQACELPITAMTEDGCPVAQAGAGFTHQSIGQPGEVVVSWTFEATPDRILDGVIGLSQDRADSFGDLAAAVRFAPSGVLDARNGGAYQADAVVPYVAGEPRQIRIIADVASQTYSAYVAGGGAAPVRLARGYSFQTPGTTGWIGELAAIVDSAGGELAVCDQQHGISIGVRFLRDGNYAVAPLPGAASLISDGASTWRLDGRGRTLAQLARGGQIAVDPAGNVYLARIAGAALEVDSYTAGFVHRWTRSYPAGDCKRVLAIGADGASVVAATGPVSGGVDLVKRWLADGTESITRAGPMGDAIAIGPAGLVIGSAINGTVVVTKWPLGPSPAPAWQRAWQHGAQIAAMAIAPDGSVGFGGTFTGSISFCGPLVEPSADGNNTYVAGLTAAGDHRFSRGLGQPAVLAIAAGEGITAVSTPARAIVLDGDGHEIRGEFGQNPVRGAGTAAPIAIGSNRVYWNFALTPLPGAPAYPYLIAYEPGV